MFCGDALVRLDLLLPAVCITPQDNCPYITLLFFIVSPDCCFRFHYVLSCVSSFVFSLHLVQRSRNACFVHCTDSCRSSITALYYSIFFSLPLFFSCFVCVCSSLCPLSLSLLVV